MSWYEPWSGLKASPRDKGAPVSAFSTSKAAALGLDVTGMTAGEAHDAFIAALWSQSPTQEQRLLATAVGLILPEDATFAIAVELLKYPVIMRSVEVLQDNDDLRPWQQIIHQGDVYELSFDRMCTAWLTPSPRPFDRCDHYRPLRVPLPMLAHATKATHAERKDMANRVVDHNRCRQLSF